MFTKYFGLFLIVGGVIGSLIFFASYGVHYTNGVLTAEIERGESLFFAVLFSFLIILFTFFVGRYFYKIGKAEKTISGLKTNKHVRLAIYLFISSMLIIPLAFLVIESLRWEESDGFEMLLIYPFGILPALIMSGVAIILLIIHWLKNRGLKYKQ